MERITQHIKESIGVKKEILDNMPQKIFKLSEMLKHCLRIGNKILVAGNGGSAADSQHMAAELIGRYRKERQSIACIALTTDTSILTAVSNDYGFDSIFERQIEAIGKKNDIFIAISTSGKSKNLIRAIEKCKKVGIKTIGLLGNNGGLLKNTVDLSLTVPSSNTPVIQECHTMIIHILCDLIEN